MIPASPGPNLLSIGDFAVHWYGVFIAIALCLGLFVATRVAKHKGIQPNIIIDISFWVLLFSFIGARVYHVWNEWWWYRDHLDQIAAFWNGGFALHGGIIAGVLTFFLIARKKKINLLILTDIAAISFLTAQIIGRPGNYFNEELFGEPTNLAWGLLVHPSSRPSQYAASESFHPLFLYEMALNAVLLAVLYVLFKKSKQTGVVTSSYLIGYGLIRFSLDFLRIDQFGFGSFTLAQWVSIVFIVSGLVLLVWRKTLTPKNVRDNVQART